MMRRLEVTRIQIPVQGPFDYAAAKADVNDADARGDSVTVEGRDLVIRTPVFVRGQRKAA